MGIEKHYRIVVAEDASDLAIHVREWIVAGWKCQGGVAFIPGWIDVDSGDGVEGINVSFMQAMIKTE